MIKECCYFRRERETLEQIIHEMLYHHYAIALRRVSGVISLISPTSSIQRDATGLTNPE